MLLEEWPIYFQKVEKYFFIESCHCNLFNKHIHAHLFLPSKLTELRRLHRQVKIHSLIFHCVTH